MSLAAVEIMQPVQEDALLSYQKDVANLLRRRSVRFPGTQPTTFTRSHMNLSLFNDFMVCEKTDGIRYLLYFGTTCTLESEPFNNQVLIDRKNQYHSILPGFMHAPGSDEEHRSLQDWHRGTLLDGELVWQRCPHGQSRLSYLIFDCLAINGESIIKHTFEKRRKILKKQFYHAWTAYMRKRSVTLRPQSLNLQMKRFLPFNRVDELFKNDICELPHGNDGIIVTCSSSSYRYGTDHSTLKWKEPKDLTIDFMVQLGRSKCSETAKQQYLLFAYHGNDGHHYFARLYLTEVEYEFMDVMRSRGRCQILECFRDSQTGHWRPKLGSDGFPLLRHDKTNANHIKVVADILRALENPVTREDLVHFAAKKNCANEVSHETYDT